MTALVLGVDIGTSGIRVSAVDRTGQSVAASSQELPPAVRQGPLIEQDAEIWWSATTHALTDLLGKVDAKAVEAIAVDGTSGTVLAIDAGGRPLAPARLYNDASAVEQAEVIAAVAPPTTAVHGVSSALGRAILLQRTPGVRRILHQADWIAGRLSGRFDVSDENNALKTGYDAVLRQWPDWIDRAGMRRDLLPVVVPAGSATGRLLPEIARRFGLPADVTVVAGTTDGCAAFLATGADRPGDGVTSLGSTLTLKLLTDAAIFAPPFGIYSHRIGDVWLAGGASNTGGAVLASFFSAARLRELEAVLDPARPSGLDYYPLVTPGERFPYNDASLQPRITPRPADDHVFLQGLLEGMATIEATGYRRLAELGATPLRSIRTVGGGAANRAWSRIRGDRLGVPSLPVRSQEAAVGVARLAWRGIGHEVAA